MPARIGPKKRRRMYLREWREYRKLTQEQLANRLGTTNVTISRWEKFASLLEQKDASQLNTDTEVAVAEALGILPEDLWHHPEQPTPNQLMRDQPKAVQEQAIKLLKALRQ